MKHFLVAFISILCIGQSVMADCSDPNLRGIKGVDWYDQLQYLNRFTLVASVDTAAPAGFSDVFGKGDDLCRTVSAQYLKHKSGTMYVVYTTHDDYCDGGNTLGIMINMKTYRNEGIDLKKSIVGEIGDSQFYCY